MINDLELSFKSIAVSIVPITEDKSGDPQYDIFDDDLLLLLSLTSLLFMTVGPLLAGLWSVSNSGLSVEDDDLIILGILESFDE
jgi:hypothetical protein